jgi:hypothetical protein
MLRFYNGLLLGQSYVANIILASCNEDQFRTKTSTLKEFNRIILKKMIL